MYKKLVIFVIGIFISLQTNLAVSNTEELEKTTEKMSACAGTFVMAQSAGLVNNEKLASELKRRVKQMGFLSTYLVKIRDENLTPSQAAVKPQQWLTNQIDAYLAIKELQGSEAMLSQLTNQIEECSAILPIVDTMSPLMYEDPEFVNYINELKKT